MHANFNEQYVKFRSLTNYPKFGWSGFGPHVESPQWLINKPLSLGLVNFDEPTLKEFAALWKTTAQQFFSTQMPEITPSLFFEKLCGDEVFSKSEVLVSVRNYLQE